MICIKKYFFLLSLLFLSSCSFFAKKEEQHLSKMDTIIDYTSVDIYPLFLNCKELEEKNEQKHCFELEMSKKIYEALKLHSFEKNTDIQDTVWVKLIITKKGFITIEQIASNTLKKQKTRKIDSLLRLHLGKSTPLQPAVKRGIPVTTLFKIPIIYSTIKK